MRRTTAKQGLSIAFVAARACVTPFARPVAVARLADLARPGLAVAALAGLLASCSVLEVGRPGRPSTPPPPGMPAMTGYPDRLNGTFNGFCEQREDDGFQEKATLRVVNRQVQTLNWRSIVGRKGSCSFELAGFRQTRSQPHLELQAADGSGCKLMVYQDARRVTLAHAGCERSCKPRSVYDQAWPVMFDPVSGRCAPLDK